MPIFRRKPEDRFHVRYPRTAGAIGGGLGGLIAATAIYFILALLGLGSPLIWTLLTAGVFIAILAGAIFPRFGHRSLFYVWCMAIGI